MNDNQRITKDQHYVPRWYLRLFSDDVISSDDKKRVYLNKADKQVSIASIFSKKWLYELPNVPVNAMENELCRVETIDSTGFQNLISYLDSVSDIEKVDLSVSEKLMLYKAMMTMAYRQPENLPNGVIFGIDVMSEWRHMIESDMTIPDDMKPKIISMVDDNLMVNVIRSYCFGMNRDKIYTYDMIKDYVFMLHRASDNVKFVTCECPFRFDAIRHFMFMPLSKNYVVIVFDKSRRNDFDRSFYAKQMVDDDMIRVQRLIYSGCEMIVSNTESIYHKIFM